MTTGPLSLGFSPCPNDTFIFHALVHGLVDGAPAFAPALLKDVETLNRWALRARLDVSKISFHALGHVLDHYVLLGVGAALGRGCGPLLVARKPYDPDELPDKRLAVPGRFTTAAMLLGLYAPACLRLNDYLRAAARPGWADEHLEKKGKGQDQEQGDEDWGGDQEQGGGGDKDQGKDKNKNKDEDKSDGGVSEMRFDLIMPAIVRGEIDAGVIIHESRFTYQRHGLVLLADLGAWWEDLSGLPIPLGGLVARRSLGPEKLAAIEAAIRESLRLARANSTGALAYIRRHAGELDEKTVAAHIDLYVNEFSCRLGEDARQAVAEFLRRGREAGILPPSL